MTKIKEKNTVKCVVTIPKKLNNQIKIYQSMKAISVKKEAIIQMLEEYTKTKNGKKLTSSKIT